MVDGPLRLESDVVGLHPLKVGIIELEQNYSSISSKSCGISSLTSFSKYGGSTCL